MSVQLTDFIFDGRCAETDPEIFFPEQSNQWNTDVPKRVCLKCEVYEMCREWALEQPQTDMHGVWGALTQTERVKIRRERKVA